MCEKCNNKKSFSDNPFTKIITGFGIPVELICPPPGLNLLELMKYISEYVNQHAKVPSSEELTQYMLSSKAKASSATKSRKDWPTRIDILQARKGALLKELEMIDAAIDEISDEKPNDGVEKSFDQLVADATAELDIFMSALEDKYNEDIVTLAAEKIMAFPVDSLNNYKTLDKTLNDALNVFNSYSDGSIGGKIDSIFQHVHVIDDNIANLGKMIYETHQALTLAETIPATLESTGPNPYLIELIEAVIAARKEIKRIMCFKIDKPTHDHLKAVSKRLKKAINKGYTATILEAIADDED